MAKNFFLVFLSFFVLAEDSLGSPGLREIWGKVGLTQRIKQGFHTRSIGRVARVDSLTFSQEPRTFICPKIKLLDKQQANSERIKIPSYAPELSKWVLNRRLRQLPKDIEQSPFEDILKERFQYKDIWLSTTSNSVIDNEEYRLVVNHTNVDTQERYYSRYDVFLRDAPHKLWVEGEWRRELIDGCYHLDSSFQVLIDNLFPRGLLNAKLSGEKLSETDYPQEMKTFIEDVLYTDLLINELYWEINWHSERVDQFKHRGIVE